jgi:hippurate hydrolase
MSVSLRVRRGAAGAACIGPAGDAAADATVSVTGVAGAMGCTAVIDYELGYPVTFNNAEKTSFVAKVAGSLVGSSNVDLAVPPTIGSEDFSFMLEERPGSYIFMGNGDSAGLHHPAYDFNDKAIPVGVSYWASIVETAMPA